MVDFALYTLSEKNVFTIYNDCLPTDSTKAPINVQLFQKELCGQESPIIAFDYAKLIIHFGEITFMMGQLHSVHAGLNFMTPPQGFFNFEEKQWTEDQSLVFTLYHLALPLGLISPFVLTSNNYYTDIRKIPITYPYGHPKFEESFVNMDRKAQEYKNKE